MSVSSDEIERVQHRLPTSSNSREPVMCWEGCPLVGYIEE